MRNILKKFICAFAAAVMFAGAAGTSVLAETPKLYLNDIDVTQEASPVIVNDTTLVPIRFIGENLGYTVNWDVEKQGASMSKDGNTYTMFIGNNIAYDSNGKETPLSAPMQLVDDKSMVPLRFLSESAGLSVQWSQALFAVFVNSETAYKSLMPADTVPFTITLENGGVMKGELYPNIAPISVDNFTKLANSGFYDGTIFHRVIPGFMVQGGGYVIEEHEGQKYIGEKDTGGEAIKGEFASNGVQNDLKHTRGVISMARTTEPNSATSQFFIMHADTASLDGEYAAFGRVTEGLDVIDKIAAVETTQVQPIFEAFPVEPVIIKNIHVGE
jgi:peptidyl-prolyl cis-trans isomerase B (cyclophilin B)